MNRVNLVVGCFLISFCSFADKTDFIAIEDQTVRIANNGMQHKLDTCAPRSSKVFEKSFEVHRVKLEEDEFRYEWSANYLEDDSSGIAEIRASYQLLHQQTGEVLDDITLTMRSPHKMTFPRTWSSGFHQKNYFYGLYQFSELKIVDHAGNQFCFGGSLPPLFVPGKRKPKYHQALFDQHPLEDPEVAKKITIESAGDFTVGEQVVRFSIPVGPRADLIQWFHVVLRSEELDRTFSTSIEYFDVEGERLTFYLATPEDYPGTHVTLSSISIGYETETANVGYTISLSDAEIGYFMKGTIPDKTLPSIPSLGDSFLVESFEATETDHVFTLGIPVDGIEGDHAYIRTSWAGAVIPPRGASGGPVERLPNRENFFEVGFNISKNEIRAEGYETADGYFNLYLYEIEVCESRVPWWIEGNLSVHKRNRINRLRSHTHCVGTVLF